MIDVLDLEGSKEDILAGLNGCFPFNFLRFSIPFALSLTQIMKVMTFMMIVFGSMICDFLFLA